MAGQTKNDASTVQSTRQMLDELDALMERMLTLPVEAPETPGSAEIKVERTRETVSEIERTRAKETIPEPPATDPIKNLSASRAKLRQLRRPFLPAAAPIVESARVRIPDPEPMESMEPPSFPEVTEARAWSPPSQVDLPRPNLPGQEFDPLPNASMPVGSKPNIARVRTPSGIRRPRLDPAPAPAEPMPAPAPVHTPPTPEPLNPSVIPTTLTPELRQALHEVPEHTLPVQSRLLLPLVWINQVFDVFTYLLGPIGTLLRAPSGRLILGVAGFGLLILAGLKVWRDSVPDWPW